MDLLTLKDKDTAWVRKIISTAIDLKKDPKKESRSLEGKVLSMLFMKPSTRTRSSFEAGMIQLGGNAINLEWKNTNFTKGALADEIRCMDRYSDILMARVFDHEQIVTIADAAEKPVINGLCNLYHPCQALADMMSAYEVHGSYDFKMAYVGDGNNVCNSLIIASKILGSKISVATPVGYEPDADVLKFGRGVELSNEPMTAVEGADFVYTDVWVSMGDEKQKEQRINDFKGFTVDDKLLSDSYFMHCLPAIRGQEVTDSVLDSKKSIVFDQAENRMHAQKAVLLELSGLL